MFEWLSDEIAQIKTNKFHITGIIDDRSPLSPEQRELLPPSYLQFNATFGGVKLYRHSNYYIVSVFAVPQAVVMRHSNRPMLYFGLSDRYGYAYFDPALLTQDIETPVFEVPHVPDEPRLRKRTFGFDKWLRTRCAKARDTYSDDEWQRILDGPAPFTNKEKRIIESRKLFKWHVVGVSENGDLQIQVKNESGITLPYLSLGVRSKTISGGIFLPISGLQPGEDRIVERDAYKKLVSPHDVELYDLPDPAPEDRAMYWEFRE